MSPYLDKESGQVVVRIVYDGPPGAGKTTNLQQLCKTMSMHRRGNLSNPMSDGRRTEFFDWVDFSGGLIDTRPVRCQLVSVPGQTTLLRRRSYLLESMDAAVFVADSSARSLRANLRALETLREAASADRRGMPVAVLLQANKQDLPDAMDAEQLALELGMADLPIIPAVATSGMGVPQTFLMAVRLATDRVRALLLEDALGEVAASPDSPEQLYAAMLRAEGSAARNASLEEFYDPVPQPSVSPASGVDAKGDSVVLPESEQRLVPWAPDIRAGHLWPPVTGRTILAAINRSNTAQSSDVEPWAPAGASEVHSDLGWVLHTTEEWTFPEEEESLAADTLRTTVSAWLGIRDTIPEGRSLILAPDDGRWRMWMISPSVRTLESALDGALTGGEVEQVVAVLCDIASAVADSRASASIEALLRQQSFDSIAVSPEKRLWCMDPFGGSLTPAGNRTDLFEQIRGQVQNLYGRNPEVAPLLRRAREEIEGAGEHATILDEIFLS